MAVLGVNQGVNGRLVNKYSPPLHFTRKGLPKQGRRRAFNAYFLTGPQPHPLTHLQNNKIHLWFYPNDPRLGFKRLISTCRIPHIRLPAAAAARPFSE